jgi:ATP dependent DNA ligase domain/ATP dependent DNA ligase C terminal region
MSLFHRGRLEIKLGEYAVGSTTALVDPLLVNVAQDYRRHTASRMIPLDASDIRKRFPASKYHVSLKVDGEFDILVYAEGQALLVNPGGTVRVGLPLLNEAVKLLQKAGIKKAILAGELHYLRPDGKRARVHDVSRVARQPASQAEVDRLAFAAFDIIQLDGKPFQMPHSAMWKHLADWLEGGKTCAVVESVEIDDAAGIDEQFRGWVDSGAEGIVVKSEEVGTFKVKPRHTLDVVVIGFTEGTDDRRGMIHDLLLAVMRADGCLQVLGHVGGGFSNDDRMAFLSDLKDMIVESDYVEVNDQVAYHMVRPEWIVEISVLDIFSQTTRGTSINKMALHWNAAAQRYENVRRLPLCGLISPQFVRKREDKRYTQQDIRLSQLTDIVEIGLTDRDARKLELPKSEILKREVYTKVLKGATMVRKLLLWRTNKEKENEDFPAYVLHSTDFSPNRKTPLERDIRVSSSREQIEEFWQELAAESFVKGWTPAGPVTASGPGTAVAAAAEVVAEAAAEKPAPKKRAAKKKDDVSASPEGASDGAIGASEEKPAPKKRAAKKKVDPPSGVEGSPDGG